MKIGTKSLLFGVHQFILHPLFVFWGWYKLYGLPNWKELICILIHDWGYWSCNDMDGMEGEKHQNWAADWVSSFLDKQNDLVSHKYYLLCVLHSRFHAKNLELPPSKLCWADKLGTALMPTWLWVFLGTLTGEIKEYMTVQKHKDAIQEIDPFEYFKVYKNKIVPELLKENLDFERRKIL
jgi:hypothetical protein